MTDKEKIREKVERIINRRLNLINGGYFGLNEETNGLTNEIIDTIDLLQKEPVSGDLEKTAMQYGTNEFPSLCSGCKHVPIDAFKAGAKWQKEKDQKK